MVALSEQGTTQTVMRSARSCSESNTLTILKKLEQTGYISRIRDPADERQVRVSRPMAGQVCSRTISVGHWSEACGFQGGDEFSVVQKNVSYDTLLRNTRGKQDET